MSSRRLPARRSWTASVALVGALLAVGGCSTTSSPEAAPASSSSTHTSVATTQSPTTPSTSSGGLAAPAPVAGACPPSTTPGQIGGAATCLAPGQPCTKVNSNEYPAYGFLCLPQGAEFVLKRK